MIREQILKVAEKEVGYAEQSGNKTKYGKWFGWDGVAWCGIFVSWVYDKCGQTIKGGGWSKGFAGCQYAYSKFKGKITKTPRTGDVILFDWNSDGRYDHTGIFVKDIDGKTFESIEGNTSLKNQSNGGQVMRRKRKYNQCIFLNLINEKV